MCLSKAAERCTLWQMFSFSVEEQLTYNHILKVWFATIHLARTAKSLC